MTAQSSNVTRLGRSERVWRAILAATWPIGLAFALIVVSNGIPFCGFAALTGLPCPFCGGTRACAALAMLDAAEAWHQSPGVVIAVVFAAGHTAFLLTEAIVGRRLRWHPPWLFGWEAIGCIMVVAWVARLAGG